MTKHVFHPSILRAYDIRGIVNETLNSNDAKAIGIAFAACLRQRGYGNHVAVGRDGRLSSPALAASSFSIQYITLLKPSLLGLVIVK